MLHGVLAAALTPLRDGGSAIDEDGIPPYVDFLCAGGVDGVLVLGTTGEGLLLSGDERRRVADAFLTASGGRLQVAVHAGAQTTADTVALASHAAESGADAVAVIGPPYFPLDEDALVAHMAAAARAAGDVPFYLYEFRARVGYTISPAVITRLRELAPNLAGLKVSNTPFDAVEPFLREGLDVFVGAEALLLDGLGHGAAGAVSGLAASFPERVVELVRTRDPAVSARVAELRRELERAPFHATSKHAVARRGVALREDVRAPLRGLTDAERARLDAWLASS